MADLRNDASLLAQQIDATTGATTGLAEATGLVAGLVRDFTVTLRDSGNSAALAGGGYDTVGIAIRVVGTIAETVIVLVANLSYMLSATIREAGGLAAQVVAVVSGNFAEARRIGEEMQADAVLARAEVDRYSERVLGMTDRVLQSREALRLHGLSSAENRSEIDRLTNSTGGASSSVATLRAAVSAKTDADRAAAAEAKKVDDVYVKLKTSIIEKTGVIVAEDEAGAKLTAGQRLALGVMQDIQSGTLRLTDTRKREITALLENYLATEDLSEAHRRNEAWLKTSGEQNDKFRDSVFAATASINDQVDKQREANEQATVSKLGMESLTIAKLLDRAATLDRNAAVMDEIDWSGQTSAEYRKQAAGLRTLAELKADGIHIKAAQDSAAEWAKTTDQIERGLTDSLFRAFESGKGFFRTLWQGVVNTFKTTILQPTIKAIISPITGGIAAFFGGTGAASASSGLGTAGTALSTASALANLGNTASGIGAFFPAAGGAISSTFSAGLGAATNVGIGASSAGAYGATITNAALAESAVAGGAAAASGGIGSTLAAAGPYALAAIAALALASKLFGSKGGPKTESGYDPAGLGGLPTTGNSGDASTILEGLQSLYSDYASKLGGIAGALSGTSFVGIDNKGNAATQLVLDATLNGRTVFSRNNRLNGGNVEDVGRDSNALAAAVADAQIRATVAALQATTFSDAKIGEMVRGLNAGMGADALSAGLQEIVTAKAEIDAAVAAAKSSASDAAASWDSNQFNSTSAAVDAANSAAFGVLAGDSAKYLDVQTHIGATLDAHTPLLQDVINATRSIPLAAQETGNAVIGAIQAGAITVLGGLQDVSNQVLNGTLSSQGETNTIIGGLQSVENWVINGVKAGQDEYNGTVLRLDQLASASNSAREQTGSLAQAIEALRAEVSGLRQEQSALRQEQAGAAQLSAEAQRQIAENTARTESLLRSVTSNGTSLNTTVVAS